MNTRCKFAQAAAAWLVGQDLMTGACLAVAKEVSLVTKQPIGDLAVAGRLSIDLHAEFMVSEKKISDDYPDGFKGANHPVVKVPWNDAEKFCNALSAQADEKGREYALPAEAQWEYACRAGTATPFAFGETISTDQANYHGGYTYGDGRKGGYREKPLPVGSLPPNAWGLYDMHGNVSEWCADRYGNYGSAAESDPQGPAEGGPHVLRGGSWRSYPGA